MGEDLSAMEESPWSTRGTYAAGKMLWSRSIMISFSLITSRDTACA